MDSIRPLQNYDGNIVPQAVLNGTLGTVVYASNYNDLDNKPSINSVELRGNKTAEDLGLATPADITVTSVNTQTGEVSLTGQNIPYDSSYSLTEKINDLESQIVDSGVSSVNGHTGAVILTGSDINYSVGVSLNAKINAVEGEIPVVDYPVTSVNSKTGAVVLAGSDIEYSEGVSINTQIENVAGDLADLTAEDIPMSGTDSTPTATAIGDLSQLTTTDKSSLVGAVNEVDEFISHLSNKYVIGGTKAASGITRVDFGVTFSSPPVVSVIPLNATSPQTYLRTCALVTLTSTYFEFVEIAIQNGSSTLVNGTDNCVWIAAGNKA